MMSFPMDARVVHLQLFVALTAHLLWALNLHTKKKKKKKSEPLLNEYALLDQQWKEITAWNFKVVGGPKKNYIFKSFYYSSMIF